MPHSSALWELTHADVLFTLYERPHHERDTPPPPPPCTTQDTADKQTHEILKAQNIIIVVVAVKICKCCRC